MKIPVAAGVLAVLATVKCAEVLRDINPFISGNLQLDGSEESTDLRDVSGLDLDEHDSRQFSGYASIDDMIDQAGVEVPGSRAAGRREYIDTGRGAAADTYSREFINECMIKCDSSVDTELDAVDVDRSESDYSTSVSSTSASFTSASSASLDGDYDIRVKLKDGLLVFYTRAPRLRGPETFEGKCF